MNDRWCAVCTRTCPIEHGHFTNLDRAHFYMHKALEDQNKIKALFLPEETKAISEIEQADAIRAEHSERRVPRA